MFIIFSKHKNINLREIQGHRGILENATLKKSGVLGNSRFSRYSKKKPFGNLRVAEEFGKRATFEQNRGYPEMHDFQLGKHASLKNSGVPVNSRISAGPRKFSIEFDHTWIRREIFPARPVVG